jgi:hypothetical protein
MMRAKQILLSVASLLIGLLLTSTPVLAQSSNSTNYRVDQTFFGTGGELDASSANYRSKQTLGELGIGYAASSNYAAFAGFNTTDDPYLEFFVIGSSIDLGYLDPSATTTATGVFSVRAWQAGGYVVRTESDPPTGQTGHQLTPLASPTASATNTEQFGINLVDNSSPNVGADLLQSPDNTFSFGSVAAGYGTVDQFKYVKGDTIALSTRSTSITTYTISYIFNITNATPSGQYTFNHILVATATY